MSQQLSTVVFHSNLLSFFWLINVRSKINEISAFSLLSLFISMIFNFSIYCDFVFVTFSIFSFLGRFGLQSCTLGDPMCPPWFPSGLQFGPLGTSSDPPLGQGGCTATTSTRPGREVSLGLMFSWCIFASNCK